jgi:hypothetical protein
LGKPVIFIDTPRFYKTSLKAFFLVLMSQILQKERLSTVEKNSALLLPIQHNYRRQLLKF